MNHPINEPRHQPNLDGTWVSGDARSADQMLDDLVEQITTRLQAGESIDHQEYFDNYPELAERLSQILPALRMLADLEHSQAEPGAASTAGQDRPLTSLGQLGDYKIIREIGRGGMGVVYKAEQISLRRQVALKVLPFASVLDQQRLTRFKNEAQAAAHLQHSNIVPVYSVGCERGVHYYAMQYIEGQTLAELYNHLLAVPGPQHDPKLMPGATDFSLVTERFLQGDFAPRDLKTQKKAQKKAQSLDATTDASGSVIQQAETTQPTPKSSIAADTRPIAELSTKDARQRPLYFRTVADLGVQVAKALDYAHQSGIVHRDVKPSNLILDAAGNCWLTDFGLALVESDPGLTMTGDIVGTLRYMSPEQSLAKRVVIDHRTDIYSLGVTLYELLTLQPAFDGNDRQELLKQIAFEEPIRPSRHNSAIPKDLETIVLKAMAKNPAERYDTAQELADDLKRFLGDQPIFAKRPSLLRRTSKWANRNRTFVRTAVVTLAIAVAIGGALLWRERSQTLAAFARETEQRELAQHNLLLAQESAAKAERNFQQTRQAVDDYFTTVSESKLLDTPGMEPLRQELLQGAVQYYQNFAAEHANDSTLRAELAASHIRLGQIYSQRESSQWIDELESVVDIVESLVAEGADVSGWTSLREGVLLKDYRGGGVSPSDGPKVRAVCERGIPVWQKLVNAHPGIAGFSHDLGGLYMILAFGHWEDGGDREQAKHAYEQGIANWQRPFPGVSLTSSQRLFLAMAHRIVGEIEFGKNNLQSAINHATNAVQLFEALELSRSPQQLASGYGYREQLEFAHSTLGRIKLAQGDREQANQNFRKVTAIVPESADEISVRGQAFMYLNEPERALADFNQAIELEPENESFYARRAEFHQSQGQYSAEIADYSRALELDPSNAIYFNNRGVANRELSNLDSALADFNRAIELMPTQAIIRSNRAIELIPTQAIAHTNRAYAYERMGRKQEALADVDSAIELDPKLLPAYSQRSRILMGMGRNNEAIEAINRGLELVLTDELLRQALIDSLMRLQRHDEAIEAINRGLEAAPNEIFRWYWMALARLAAGDSEGYRDTCDQMLEKFAETEDAPTAHFTAWSCALAADAVDDFSAPVTLAKRAVEKDPENVFHVNTFGAVLYRAGRFDEALARLDEAESLQTKPDSKANSSPAYTWFFLAMTHSRLGDVDKARQWYDKAAAWTSEVLVSDGEDGTAKPSVPWNRRLTLELLQAETEQLWELLRPRQHRNKEPHDRRT